MNKYASPYCKKCKLIWGRDSIGLVYKCTNCGESLILKSFNPWPRVIVGLSIIILTILTFFLPQMPIIWIGGFFLGGGLIYNSYSRWEKILDLDKKRESDSGNNKNNQKLHWEADEQEEKRIEKDIIKGKDFIMK